MHERGEHGETTGAPTQWGEQRGAGLPLVALVLATVVIMTSVVIGLSVRVLDRTQAQSAADAAALAGVVEGRSAAARLAAANGGVLVVFEEASNVVRVVVEVDGWRAEARAERSLEPATGGG